MIKICEMEAGKELNTIVGEKLGLSKPFRCPRCGGECFGTSNDIVCCHGHAIGLMSYEGCSWTGTWADIAWPEYSRDVAAAWSIVNKLIAMGKKVYITATADGHECLISSNFKDHVHGIAYTAALAICRGALLSLEMAELEN